MDKKPSFWATLPGILTGLAAVLTALSGFYVAVRDDLPWSASTAEVAVEQSLADALDHPAPLAAAEATQDGDAVGIAVPAQAAGTATAPAGEVSLRPLVDCLVAAFQLNNTLRSLMSWSDHYHDEIVATTRNGGSIDYPCRQALSYRGSAHCQAPDDPAIRQALFETLGLCRDAGFDVGELTGGQR